MGVDAIGGKTNNCASLSQHCSRIVFQLFSGVENKSKESPSRLHGGAQHNSTIFLSPRATHYEHKECHDHRGESSLLSVPFVSPIL